MAEFAHEEIVICAEKERTLAQTQRSYIEAREIE